MFRGFRPSDTNRAQLRPHRFEILDLDEEAFYLVKTNQPREDLRIYFHICKMQGFSLRGLIMIGMTKTRQRCT